MGSPSEKFRGANLITGDGGSEGREVVARAFRLDDPAPDLRVGTGEGDRAGWYGSKASAFVRLIWSFVALSTASVTFFLLADFFSLAPDEPTQIPIGSF